MKRLALFLLLPVIAVAMPGPVRGGAIEARYFDDRARSEFASRRYEAALALFLQVQIAAPSAGTLYNIGVSAELARQPGVAYVHFEEFVRSPSANPAHRADAERRMRVLETSLARVRVTTDPPGATVWVDRRELGSWGESPRTLVLEPGAHTLELELAGRRTERVEVVAVRGEAVDLERALAPELGTLRVEVIPEGARIVAVDALGVEREISAGAIELPIGAYRVHAELAGHRPAEREVVVQIAEPQLVRLAPQPIPPATGRLLATAGQVRATVVIDGAPRGETPARIDAIQAGEHDVEIRAEGYVSWRGSVTVVADRAAFVDVTLVPRR